MLFLAGDRLRQVLGHTRARRPRRKSAYGDEVPVRAPRKLDTVGLQGALGFCLTCKPVWQLALIKGPVHLFDASVYKADVVIVFSRYILREHCRSCRY